MQRRRREVMAARCIYRLIGEGKVTVEHAVDDRGDQALGAKFS